METRTTKRETRNNAVALPRPRADRLDWIERSHWLAVRIIKMSNHLPKSAAGRVIAGQIVRSAPSIAMNLEEARGALTARDTLHKTGIARREARETLRWLFLIRDAEILPSARLESLIKEADELVAMLTTGCKRLQQRLARSPGRSA